MRMYLKQWAAAGAVSLFCVATTQAAYKDAVLNDNPVGYWRLGESSGATTAANLGSAGTGGDGTYQGTVTFGVSGAVGDNNTAISSASNSAGAVEIPYDGGAFGTASFTIEGWAKPLNGNKTFSIAGSRQQGPRGYYLGFVLYTTSTGWHFELHSGDNANKITTTIVDPSADVSADWTHVVGTYDATSQTMALYVNGAKVISQTDVDYNPYITGTGSPEVGLRIGSSYLTGGLQATSGLFDEVAYYDRALTATEIASHYAAVPEPASLSLLALGGLVMLRRRRR